MTGPVTVPPVDAMGCDVLVRIRVHSKPGATEVAVLQIVTPNGDSVEILGMAQLDDRNVNESWARFRARATAWTGTRPPRDFLKFDLFNQSRIPQAVLTQRPGGPTAAAIRMGGLSVADVEETFAADQSPPARTPPAAGEAG